MVTALRLGSEIRLRSQNGEYLFAGNFIPQRQHGSRQKGVGIQKEADDTNTVWLIKEAHNHLENLRKSPEVPAEAVIRLENRATSGNLHSHSGPRTIGGQQEVTCFGRLLQGDTSDDWRISLTPDINQPSGLSARLKHVATGRWLTALSTQLRFAATNDAQGADVKEVGATAEETDQTNWAIELINDGKPRKRTPILTLDFGVGVTKVPVFKLPELEQMLAAEAQKWNWSDKLPREPNITAVRQQIEQSYQLYRNQLNGVKESVDNESLSGGLQAFSNLIQQLYGSSKLIHSQSPAGLHLQELAKTDPTVATFALATASKINFPLNDSVSARGFYAWMEYENKRSPSYPEHHQKALDRLYEDAREKSDTLGSDIEQFQERANGQLNRSKGDLDELGENTRSQIELLVKKAAASVSEAEKEFDRRTNALRKEWPIKESVLYWKERGQTHRKIAVWCAASFLFLGVSACFLIWWQLGKIGDLTSASWVGGSTFRYQIFSSSMAPLYVEYAALLLMVSALVWPLKIIVRVMLSHLQQAAESFERTTMVKTFIALIADGSIKDVDEKRLLLETLFRPGNTALLNDDSGPATQNEIILKNFKGGGP